MLIDELSGAKKYNNEAPYLCEKKNTQQSLWI